MAMLKRPIIMQRGAGPSPTRQMMPTTTLRQLARTVLLLLLCLPFAVLAQGPQPIRADLEIAGQDAHLRVSVKVSSISEQRYQIAFENVGTQALIVPTGSCLFFQLFFSRGADSSLSCATVELIGGVDAGHFKHMEQIEVTTLSPGESLTYQYAQPSTENVVAKLTRQHCQISIGYGLLEADEDIEGISYGSFLRNAHEIQVWQHTEGDQNCVAPAHNLGHYGGLESWARE